MLYISTFNRGVKFFYKMRKIIVGEMSCCININECSALNLYQFDKFWNIVMEAIKTPKVFTAILFFPTLGFFTTDQQILSHSHFVLVIALIALSYLCYTFSFQSKSLNFLRKCLGCLSTAALALFLSAEVSDILVSVYKVSFGDEITFMIKLIFMLSNM